MLNDTVILLPSCWQALNKGGNSNQTEKIDLLNFFVRYFLPYLPNFNQFLSPVFGEYYSNFAFKSIFIFFQYSD